MDKLTGEFGDLDSSLRIGGRGQDCGVRNSSLEVCEDEMYTSRIGEVTTDIRVGLSIEAEFSTEGDNELLDSLFLQPLLLD